MNRFTRFIACLVVITSAAVAENPAAPVAKLNRIAPQAGLPYVELDGKLHFKNSADRVNFASELGIAGGVVGVTEVAGHSGVVTLGDLSLDHVGNATTGNGSLAIGNGSITISGAGQITAKTSPTNLQTTDGTLDLLTFGAVKIKRPDVGSVKRDFLTSKVLSDWLPTPQDYGAIADGNSHKISSTWIPSRYANLAAVQVDYPEVVSADDEVDWAAGQQALHLYNIMYLPTGQYTLGNTESSHMWNANQDNGQRIIGAGRYVDPTSRAFNPGVRINAGPGNDGIRFASSSGTISDVTVYGAAVSISSLTSAGGVSQAVLSTGSTPHGLRTTPFISGGWTILSNTTGVSPIVTTSAPHYLSSGDYVKVTSTESGITGIFRVLPTDAAGNLVPNPSTTATHFRLVKEDRTEPSAATSGTGSLARVYTVFLGPYIGDGREVTGAVPEVVGIYRLLPTGTTAASVYKWDNTPLVLTTNANANTGILFSSFRAVTFGDDNSIINSAGPIPISDADSGRMFSATNVYGRNVAIAIDGQSSDGSGKIDHCFADTVAIGMLAGGNIDNMTVDACWVTRAALTAYMINGNGGMQTSAASGANNARLFWLGKQLNGETTGGSHLNAVGSYNEGIHRNLTQQGEHIYPVDLGSDNGAAFESLTITAMPARTCTFHLSGQGGFLSLINSPNSGYIAWNQGANVYADPFTHLKVNFYGSEPLGDYQSYMAGDYKVRTQADTFNLTQFIGGIAVSGSTVTVTVEDGTKFSNGDHIALRDTPLDVNNVGFATVTGTDSTHVVFTSGTNTNAGGGGIIEKLEDLDGATFSNIGLKYLILPESTHNIAYGMWQVLNIGGRPTWTHVGFDSLEVARGGTGQTIYTAGDLLYATGSSTLTKLPKGSDGQVLTIDPTTHLPVWAASTGSITTYSISGTFNTPSGTTMTNMGAITLPSVAVGTYNVHIRGQITFGAADGGWKWDLKGGAAVFSSNIARYNGLTNIYSLVNSFAVNAFLAENGTSIGGLTVNDGNIYNGETWSSVGNGTMLYDYVGTLNVTTAGSVIMRMAQAGAGTTGNIPMIVLELIKQ